MMHNNVSAERARKPHRSHVSSNCSAIVLKIKIKDGPGEVQGDKYCRRRTQVLPAKVIRIVSSGKQARMPDTYPACCVNPDQDAQNASSHAMEKA
jgi:hypothetical protein